MLKYELLTYNYWNINTNKYIILSIISKHPINIYIYIYSICIPENSNSSITATVIASNVYIVLLTLKVYYTAAIRIAI